MSYRTSNPYVVKPSVPGWGNSVTMQNEWVAA